MMSDEVEFPPDDLLMAHGAVRVLLDESFELTTFTSWKGKFEFSVKKRPIWCKVIREESGLVVQVDGERAPRPASGPKDAARIVREIAEYDLHLIRMFELRDELARKCDPRISHFRLHPITRDNHPANWRFQINGPKGHVIVWAARAQPGPGLIFGSIPSWRPGNNGVMQPCRNKLRP